MSQVMIIEFLDGSYIKGVRKWHFPFRETKGTHHFIVEDFARCNSIHKGDRIAIPISSVKYFVLGKI